METRSSSARVRMRTYTLYVAREPHKPTSPHNRGRIISSMSITGTILANGWDLRVGPIALRHVSTARARASEASPHHLSRRREGAPKGVVGSAKCLLAQFERVAVLKSFAAKQTYGTRNPSLCVQAVIQPTTSITSQPTKQYRTSSALLSLLQPIHHLRESTASLLLSRLYPPLPAPLH